MAKKAAAKKGGKATGSSKKATVKLGDPMKTFQSIQDTVKVMEEDLRKFVDEDVKAAARRARQGAQAVRKAAQQLRKEIQAKVIANRKKK